MPPPAEGEFSSLPELMKSVLEHGRAHGYACVTASNNYKRGIAYVRCDRGGKYVNHWNLTEENRVRKNRTIRLVGCQWKARAKRTNANTWVLSMMTDTHNGHGPSPNANSHPSLRQLPQEAMDEVRIAFKNNRASKEVLEMVKERWNPDITAQDVYNLKAKLARIDQGLVKKVGNSKGVIKNVTDATANDPPMDPMLQQMQPVVPVAPASTVVGTQTEGCACQCCEH